MISYFLAAIFFAVGACGVYAGILEIRHPSPPATPYTVDPTPPSDWFIGAAFMIGFGIFILVAN